MTTHGSLLDAAMHYLDRRMSVTRANRGVIVCPICGYNLTGLHEARCPECGSRFTLDQLLTAQPAREDVESSE